MNLFYVGNHAEKVPLGIHLVVLPGRVKRTTPKVLLMLPEGP
jgi:hypothetical protein